MSAVGGGRIFRVIELVSDEGTLVTYIIVYIPGTLEAGSITPVTGSRTIPAGTAEKTPPGTQVTGVTLPPQV